MELNLKKPLAIFDLETTGVNVGSDHIVEIYILKVDANGDQHEFNQRVNPGIPIPPESTAIHGITDGDVANEPLFKDIAQKLLQFIGSADLAGFNSNKFDIPLLVEEFFRVDIDFELKNRRFIDVMGIFHKMESRTLKAAYKFYCGKPLVNAHSAKADAVATYEILKAQIEKYAGVDFEDIHGNISQPIINDVEQLSIFSKTTQNADLVGHIVFNEKGEEVFNFGKFKGQTVIEVFRKETQYYDWMMKSSFPMSTKKLITTIKLRGFNSDGASINSNIKR